jgi:hypothetical protein
MEAVEAANPGDTIQVFPGVYDEAVVVPQTKNNLVLRARVLTQPPAIVATPLGAVAVTLQARGVQLQHFVIHSSSTALKSDGVLGSTRALIDGNLIIGGMALEGCTSSRIAGNVFLNGGIVIANGASACTIDGNQVDDGSIMVGSGDFPRLGNKVRRNMVTRGAIQIATGNPVKSNLVEFNWLGTGVLVSGLRSVEGNVIRGNVMRGGRIELGIVTGPLGVNIIESNLVSGAPGDGILVRSAEGGSSLIRSNTSVDNTTCDINDTQGPAAEKRNTWKGNRFVTRCGSAWE